MPYLSKGVLYPCGFIKIRTVEETFILDTCGEPRAECRENIEKRKMKLSFLMACGESSFWGSVAKVHFLQGMANTKEHKKMKLSFF